jgi:NADH:ubiquinone reductase (H+-translocating)
MNNKTKIVIIGGGFGGIYTAQSIEKTLGDRADITLINKNNYFLFTPLLHEVATGGLTSRSVTESIREIFRGESTKFIEDTVIEVDKINKLVKTNNATFSYDYLVVSSGAEMNYFGVSGAIENTFTLKSLTDAIAIRNHILQTFEQAISTKNKDLLTFSVIGGGATGVELASELIEYVKHTLCTYYKNSGFKKNDVKVNLITNTPDLISQFPEKMRTLALDVLMKRGVSVLTNTAVSKIEPHKIITADNKEIHSHTIVWVAGVKPSLSNIKGIDIGAKGRLDVNEYLQSIQDKNVFGLGDSAGALPMLAQIAVQQAKTVAGNIVASIESKEMIKFETHIKGLLISLGQWSALGQFGKVTLSGPIMWFIWRTIYLFNFHSWKKRFEIALEWTANIFYPRDITYIK